MNSKTEVALAKLDAIEAEMRRIGYWAADPPDLRATVSAGRIKSFLDAPSFELWLQCIFLPSARYAARENTFPGQSRVGLMAMRQYDYLSQVPGARDLLRLLSEFDAIVEGTEGTLATGAQVPSDDPRLPKASDFPPGTSFMIKEFDTPLARVPGQGWICWWGGTPRPYDPRSLKVDNNWLADSFEEWVGIVEASLQDQKAILKKDEAKADAEYERLRGQLDPQDPQFGNRVEELFLAAEFGGTGRLGKKIALLSYLVENDLAPAMPGFIKFHPETVQMFSLVSLYMNDPQALGLLTAVCEHELAKYPDDQMAAAQAEAFLRPREHRVAEEGKVLMSPIEGMLEWYRKDPAAADEAEKNWQSGREWPEARAERGNAHRLFRLVESKAKLQRP